LQRNYSRRRSREEYISQLSGAVVRMAQRNELASEKPVIRVGRDVGMERRGSQGG